MFGLNWIDPAWMEKFVIPSGLNLLSAILVLIVGIWLASRVRSLLRRILKKSKLDLILVKFFGDICYWVLVVAVVLAALDQLGVNVTSLMAIVGAAGLAVGLAMKDSLSNFAAGVMLISFRPFTLGDYVDAGGVSGTVETTGLFSTTLLTPDNKMIIVPNASVFGSTIVNYSAKATRRIDLVIGISYGDDIRIAKLIIEKLFAEDDRIFNEPAPVVSVAALADSCIELYVRPWVKKEDYWAVRSDLQQAIKERFDAEGITIPFPQRDVHVHKND